MSDEPNDQEPEENTAIKSPESVDTDEMSEEQLAEAKQYNHQKLIVGLIEMAVDVVFLAIIAFLVAQPIDQWLIGVSWLQNMWIRLAAFFTIIGAASFCVSLPFSYYSGFVLEHRFGMSRQTIFRWLLRLFKGGVLSFLFGLLMVEGLFFMIWLTGAYWWLAASAAFFAVSVLIGQLMPILILPLFYKVERLEDEELMERFEKLAKGTDLSIEGVYRLHLSAETTKANAALTGLGRTRRVLLGDTLIDKFTLDEIEVVLAHEIGHHVFRHIPKLILFGLIYSTISFFLCDVIVKAWVGEGFRYDAVPVYALPMLVLVITVFSTLLAPLKNVLSRRFERQCDQYALQRTGLKESFLSAFHKLAKQNKADPNPHPLEVILLHDHPPISERLQMAKDY